MASKRSLQKKHIIRSKNTWKMPMSPGIIKNDLPKSFKHGWVPRTVSMSRKSLKCSLLVQSLRFLIPGSNSTTHLILSVARGPERLLSCKK